MLKERKELIRDKIKKIAVLFYQKKDVEGYMCINELIQLLTELLEYMNENEGLKEQNIENIIKINEILRESVMAMMEKDTVLLADIIQYDLQDVLDLIES